MDTDDELLIPDEVTQEEMGKVWTEDAVKRSVLRYVRSSVGDVINRALLFERNSMLDREKIRTIAMDLCDLTSYKEFDVVAFIIDQLFHKALDGTTTDRDAMLQILDAFVEKIPLNTVTMSLLFSSVRNILFTKIPTPEELEAEVAKKPGIWKMYFMRSSLAKLETDLRKLVRTSEIAAFLFLKQIGGATTIKFVPQMIRELILNGDCPNLHSFYVIVSLLKTICEKRSTWGGYYAPYIERDFMNEIYRTLGDFLLAFRVTHWAEPETLTFTHGIFVLAFKELTDMNVKRESEYFKSTRHETVRYKGYKSEELYWRIIESHYSKTYNLSFRINPRVFRHPNAPRFFPGKPMQEEKVEGQRLRQIEDISLLMQQGLFKIDKTEHRIREISCLPDW